MKMKTKTILVAMLLAVIPFTAGAETSKGKAEKAILPDGTYMFAQRDTCDLFLDVYDPAEGSETSVGGKEKPGIPRLLLWVASEGPRSVTIFGGCLLDRHSRV